MMSSWVGNHETKILTSGINYPTIFYPSSRNRVDLQSYKSKPTKKREQYDWMDEKIGRVVR